MNKRKNHSKPKGYTEYHFRTPDNLAKKFNEEAAKERRSAVAQFCKILEERYGDFV